MAYRVAGGLASLGIGKGDTVAIMLNNRWEFIPIDLGAAYLGAVPFSIYQTSSPEQIQYVCEDADATVMIIESDFLDVFNEAKKDLPKLEHVVVIDGEGGTHTLEDLEGLDSEFDARAAADDVGPDDLLTLIYTSGTTGPPKGVQLTQRNLMTLVAGLDDMIEFPDRGSKVISWLPAAHIAERGANYYLPMMKGASVTICADPRKVVETLPDGQPDVLLRGPAHLGEGQGRPRGQARRDSRRGRREGARRPRRRDQEGASSSRRARTCPRSSRPGWPRPTRPCSSTCARRSASTRRSRSTSAPRRLRSRCSSSSTRSASRSASSGGCPRPAARRPSTRPTR